MALTPLDLAILAVVGLSTALALLRGAVREALGIAAWIGALLVGYLSFQPARELVRATLTDSWLADGIAAIAVLVLPIIVLRTAAGALAGHLGGGLFGLLDRLAGAAFGAARGALLVSAAYLGLTLMLSSPLHPAWVQNAILLPYIRDGANLLRAWLPDDLVAPPTLAEATDSLLPAPQVPWINPDRLPDPEQPHLRERY